MTAPSSTSTMELTMIDCCVSTGSNSGTRTATWGNRGSHTPSDSDIIWKVAVPR